MRFSPSTRCFYPEDFDYPVLPVDLINASQQEFEAAMNRQPDESLEVVNGSVVVVPTQAVFNPTAVPQTVSKYQGMAALYEGGHLESIEAYMADPNTPFLTRLAWQQIQTFDRDSPMLNGIAQLRGLSDAEVDQLFIAAAAIKA